jgi:hypothetical protein
LTDRGRSANAWKTKKILEKDAGRLTGFARPGGCRTWAIVDDLGSLIVIELFAFAGYGPYVVSAGILLAGGLGLLWLRLCCARATLR